MAAQLRLADHLAAGPRTAGELAVTTETRIDPLRRVLRGLVEFRLLSEGSDDVFELTDIGSYLRSDVPDEQRTWALMWGHEMFPRAWGDLTHALKTGGIPFDHVFGQPFYEYLAEHDDVAHVFNDGMTAFSRREREAVLATYDFASCKTVVDVGGGTGGLVAGICTRYPTIQGVVFDLPSAQMGAEQTFRIAALDSRCRFVVGNFFEAAPPAGDRVVLFTHFARLRRRASRCNPATLSTRNRTCRSHSRDRPARGSVTAIARQMPWWPICRCLRRYLGASARNRSSRSSSPPRGYSYEPQLRRPLRRGSSTDGDYTVKWLRTASLIWGRKACQ